MEELRTAAIAVMVAAGIDASAAAAELDGHSVLPVRVRMRVYALYARFPDGDPGDLAELERLVHAHADLMMTRDKENTPTRD